MQAGDRLAAGMTIHGACTIRFPDGSIIKTDSETTFQLPVGVGEQATLHQGLCTAIVEKQQSGSTFSIGNRHGNCVVLGTQFTMQSSPGSPHLSLRVQEGRVVTISTAVLSIGGICDLFPRQHAYKK